MADEQNQVSQSNAVTDTNVTTPPTDTPDTPQVDEGKAVEPQSAMPDLLGESQAEDTKPAAPEKYEAFRLGENSVVEAEGLEAFTEAARKHGLSQEAAQEFVDSLAPSVENHLRARVIEQAKHWAEDAQADKEIGGADFKANIATAKRAYDHFATDELRNVLTATGLSNHPEVLRLFYRLGKTLQQDSGVQGAPVRTAVQDTWYPNSPQMRR